VENDPQRLLRRPKDNFECKLFWPPRVKGDTNISRMRLIDLVKILDDEEYDEIKTLKLDYILISNLIIYMISFGIEWFRKLRKTGLMDSWSMFSIGSRRISTIVKRSEVTHEIVKQHFSELQSLLGYQQLPFKGDGIETKEYNLEEEMEALANSGELHGLLGDNWDETFDRALRQISNRDYNEKLKYISFEEFVKEGHWLTSGSSSIGEVHWEVGEEKGHFKARKNMVMDIYTKEELWDIVRHWDGKQENRSVIKNELGKVRLAVATGLELYLSEAYLFYITGHLYKTWSGITLDESVDEDINRVLATEKLFKDGSYALPFDYAGFDHQVTTQENKKIIKYYFEYGLLNVPIAERNAYIALLDKVVDSYSNSVLTSKIDGKEIRFDIKGGLPSGVRITSLIGNIWNSVMTQIAKNLVQELLGYDPTLRVSLRGDDSLIVCGYILECYLFRLCYQAINARGNSNKFAISTKSGEFLRTIMTEDSRFGYANRAIPSITQRKPWNPEVWEPNFQVKTIRDNIDLLERRLNYRLDRLHLANKIQWSKWTKQSYKWLELPKRLGGVGLYEFRGWVTNAKLSLSQKPLIRVQDLKDSNLEISWITLEQTEKQKYMQLAFEKKIISSDVPGMQKYYTRRVLSKYKQIKPDWYKQELPRIEHIQQSWPLGNENLEVLFPKYKTLVFESVDTNFPNLSKFLEQYSIVSRIKDIGSLTSYLKSKYPDFAIKMQSYTKAGFHKTDAITLAMGDIPTELPTKINPILTPYIKKSIEEKGIKYQRGRKNIALKLYSWTRSTCIALNASRFARNYRF